MDRKRAVGLVLCAFLFIVAILCIGVSCAVGEGPEKYAVRYRPSDASEGIIMGKTDQFILPGEDADAVEAVAEKGYIFIGWSDGIETAIRRDKSIQGDMTVYAGSLFFKTLRMNSKRRLWRFRAMRKEYKRGFCP